MGRFRVARPGFMGTTLAGALLIPPGFGYLAQRYADAEAVREAHTQQTEEATRDFADHGWKRVTTGPPAAWAQALEARHGVVLYSATRPFRLSLYPSPITARPASHAAQASAAPVIVEELSRYPGGALRQARFRRILLCQDLAEGGTVIPSLPNYQQTLLLDVAGSPQFLRRLIHHELFHFIDYADDDQVRRDPAWAALNDPSFSYGEGGRRMREPGASELTNTLPGFLSVYSTAALEEDKAEVFSFLLTQPETVRRIAQRDAVIARKVAAVRDQVTTQLPALSHRFWSEIESVRR